MTDFDSTRPFVLLDDARPGGKARLFTDLVREIAAYSADQVASALETLRAERQATRHIAGYLGYETGLALEPKLRSRDNSAATSETPLLWFGVFDTARPIDAATLADPDTAWIGTPRPRVNQEAHAEAVARAQALIAAGDIYQVNLSFRADVPFAGEPLALYGQLRARGGGGWGGIVFDGRRWLLSCSPELFFTLEGDRLTARPMKGTAPAGSDPRKLHDDPKQRAENLMIVDLIRNDLSRIAVPGSVAVPALFEIEHYPTIDQMTSTITARKASGRDAIDALHALFPCGSITGAPKIRAMEIIAELETDARGPYTGAIGYLAPNGDAAFNVAIRTLMIEPGAERAELGLGSAIVADSIAGEEWRECLAKGAFVTAGSVPFDLIETVRFDATEGLVDLERHLSRLRDSATAFDFSFDRHALRNDLQAATFRLRSDRRIRIRLSPSGTIAIEASPMPATPGLATVTLTKRPIARDDFRLHHKTSDRDFYDHARTAAGSFEIVFVDEEGYLTEGSFTSVFVPRGAQLHTPPRARGLLPGILRGRLIDEGKAIEGDLRAEDLQGEFFIGNALRGLIPARLVAAAG